MMCVRMEECVSASGTPTAATAQPVTEARTVNKVTNVCVCVWVNDRWDVFYFSFYSLKSNYLSGSIVCVYVSLTRCACVCMQPCELQCEHVCVYLQLSVYVHVLKTSRKYCVFGRSTGIRNTSLVSVWLMQQSQWKVSVKPLLTTVQTLNMASGFGVSGQRSNSDSPLKTQAQRMKQKTHTLCTDPIAVTAATLADMWQAAHVTVVQA